MHTYVIRMLRDKLLTNSADWGSNLRVCVAEANPSLPREERPGSVICQALLSLRPGKSQDVALSTNTKRHRELVYISTLLNPRNSM